MKKHLEMRKFCPNPSEAKKRFGLDAGIVKNPQDVFMRFSSEAKRKIALLQQKWKIEIN